MLAAVGAFFFVGIVQDTPPGLHTQWTDEHSLIAMRRASYG